MKPFAPLTILLSITALICLGCLTSCSGGTNATVSSINGTKISELTFKDPGLERCVKNHAETNNWQTAEQFSHLNCRGYGKRRSAGYSSIFIRGKPYEAIVANTEDLDNFPNLETLDLSGNLFQDIELGALSKLKKLYLNSTFIKELNLRQNPLLEELYLAGTIVRDLDLSHQTDLKILDASQRDLDQYTSIVIGMANRENDGKPFHLKVEQTQQGLEKLILPTNSNLTHLLLGPDSSLPIQLDSVNHLVKIEGAEINAETIDAAQLQSMDVSVNGVENLDLRYLEALKNASIRSNSLRELYLPQELESLNLKSPIELIEIPENTELRTLNLHASSEKESNLFNTQILNALKLEQLSINHYFLGRTLWLDRLPELKEVSLINVKFDIGIMFPENLKRLNIKDCPSLPRFSNIDELENLESLLIENTPFSTQEDSKLKLVN